jgi:hypothetical protein
MLVVWTASWVAGMQGTGLVVAAEALRAGGVITVAVAGQVP